MTNETETDLIEFERGFHEGVAEPGEILRKERSWFWAGHFHGQIEGMAQQFATAQGTTVNCVDPSDIFEEFVENNS